VPAHLRDYDAIECDVILTEQTVEEITVHGRVVRSVQILPRTGKQFTPDVEIDIEICVGIVIGRYKKFQIILIHGTIGLYAVSIVPSTDF